MPHVSCVVQTGGSTFVLAELSPSAREEIVLRVILESMGWEFVSWR